MVTLDELKSALQDNKEDILREINVRFTEIKMDMKHVKEVAVRAESQASKNEATILKLQGDLSALEAVNKSLFESLDDQINRSLRTTLIFKGFKEEPHETWIQTEKTLSEVIARQLNMDVGQVEDMIERAHRGNASQTRQGPRHIYAKFYSWKDSELIKENFAEQNRKHPKMNLRAEQMFSPDLTKRRNAAMLDRKKLLDDKIISNGYVKFPATLMVKKKKTDKFYVKHESY